jgi:hypothetical protein
LMVCPKCGEVFCVPAVVEKLVMFHAPCDVALTRRMDVGRCPYVTRASVVFSGEVFRTGVHREGTVS